MSGRTHGERDRRVLMIAFHYPPLKGSSGIQRTLKFSKYLLEFGWNPIVLSARPIAYAQTSDEQIEEIPAEVPVERAFALDTARHLRVFGRYPRSLAIPDRWMSWWFGGVLAGLRCIRRYRPEFIWSTYPIATAHRIAATLHRRTGVPWIADCRDSMTEPGYPSDLRQRRAYLRLERAIAEQSTRAVFTTPGTRAMYAERYPEQPDERWAVIPNGYDEENFADAGSTPHRGPPESGRPIRLLHSGILYPSERDPTRFFRAIAALKRDETVRAGDFEVVLRASGHDDVFRGPIADLDIGDVVKLEPALPYHEALAEMCATDGLLVFQAANCNHQIPAKVYEYMRSGRPILALTDPAGDTAGVLREAGYDAIARLDSEEEITSALRKFVGELREGRGFVADRAVVARHSRREGARKLAELLDSLSAGSAPGEDQREAVQQTASSEIE